mmetsp:Transcript_21155/g.32452  ORF Transcript_21155/g.32452 Transcript_21155/m.32452 type:complete len:216 (-) Transcript_21155:103-750(-)
MCTRVVFQHFYLIQSVIGTLYLRINIFLIFLYGITCLQMLQSSRILFMNQIQLKKFCSRHFRLFFVVFLYGMIFIYVTLRHHPLIRTFLDDGSLSQVLFIQILLMDLKISFKTKKILISILNLYHILELLGQSVSPRLNVKFRPGNGKLKYPRAAQINQNYSICLLNHQLQTHQRLTMLLVQLHHHGPLILMEQKKHHLYPTLSMLLNYTIITCY